jgi:hypothetical protein
MIGVIVCFISGRPQVFLLKKIFHQVILVLFLNEIKQFPLYREYLELKSVEHCVHQASHHLKLRATSHCKVNDSSEFEVNLFLDGSTEVR